MAWLPSWILSHIPTCAATPLPTPLTCGLFIPGTPNLNLQQACEMMSVRGSAMHVCDVTVCGLFTRLQPGRFCTQAANAWRAHYPNEPMATAVASSFGFFFFFFVCSRHISPVCYDQPWMTS